MLLSGGRVEVFMAVNRCVAELGVGVGEAISPTSKGKKEDKYYIANSKQFHKNMKTNI